MTCPAASYVRRKPESLVIGGYRGIVECAINGETPAGEAAAKAIEDLHRKYLGPAETRVVLDGLTSFIGTLSRCATCPLRAFPPTSSHLCRDECLVLALVAALQHGDEQACHLSAHALTCPARMGETIAAGGEYAMRMQMFGQVLLPVPPLVLSEILSPATGLPTHHSHTLH